MLSLTFDIDWAPDWAVALCADICQKAGVKATFFATHAADVLKDLATEDRFEIGIHPNFLPGSSHGVKTSEVVDHVLTIAPQAKAMRTHALVQSSPIFAGIVADTDIDTDVSLFLPFHPMLAPTKIYFEAGGRPLVRLPYYWEDDVAACWPGWSWDSVVEDAPGQLRIYDFHPIHIALNMSTMNEYARLKAELKGRPLTSLTRAECLPFINQGKGARNYLEQLVAMGNGQRFQRISDITQTYLEA
ncbi:hypothetical protein [Polaromonas sp. YR568]|uniref:polysaccharide deacetylase WbmS family protein n=1 Tax=Polaromonas sp. YR568 TaxID=1855301 RepID=UPI00398BC1E9